MTAIEARALMPRHRDPEKVGTLLTEQVYPAIEKAASSDTETIDIPLDDGYMDAVATRLRQDGFNATVGDGRLIVKWRAS